ncbi:MAG: HAMP domain-containing histidine kinase [Cyanobacteria bacterium SIG26]|nr:HAMP domain-containing histidine kinase [Cyanobacteria bacterium SIG26]
MREILDNSNEIKQMKSVISNLVHDLKNATQAQKITIDLLYKGSFGPLNSEQKTMLGYMSESVDYMNSLLYSVMSFYTKDVVENSLNKTEFDMVDLLQVCINEISGPIEQKQIKIRFNIPIGFNGLICADHIQLRRVFGNLLNNAINYSLDNTELKICIKTIADKFILSFSNEVDIALNSTVNTGWGLGLSICEQIIKEHNGSFSYEKKRCEFVCTIELPVG